MATYFRAIQTYFMVLQGIRKPLRKGKDHLQGVGRDLKDVLQGSVKNLEVHLMKEEVVDLGLDHMIGGVINPVAGHVTGSMPSLGADHVIRDVINQGAGHVLGNMADLGAGHMT